MQFLLIEERISFFFLASERGLLLPHFLVDNRLKVSKYSITIYDFWDVNRLKSEKIKDDEHNEMAVWDQNGI